MKLTSKAIGINRLSRTKKFGSGKRLSRVAMAIALFSLPTLGYAGTPLKVGSEFLVNTHMPENQLSSSVGRLNDGQFVIVWQSKEQDGSVYGIYAQRYDASGSPVGSEFRVNSITDGSQVDPEVATLHDGSFVVVWATNKTDGAVIAAQHFNVDGTRAGEQVTLHNSAAQSVHGVSISPLSTGGYIIGWSEYSRADSDTNSFASVFNNSGVMQSSQPMKKSGASFPEIVQTSDNGFLMIAKSTRASRLIGQQYDANGDVDGTEFFVSTVSGFSESSPSIYSLYNGEFVVVWTSLDRDGDAVGVYARHFDSNVVAKGDDFVVNTHTQDDQTSPSGTALDNGGYLITWYSWQQDGSNYGIFAQAFNNDGSRNGEEFQVNTTTDDTQFSPAISAISSNDFVVSWSGKLASGDYNVYAQRFQLEAVQADTMTLSMPQSTVLQGDVITLPLHVSGNDIYGLDAVVSLSDTTKARISGGEYGEFLPSDERLSVPMGISDNQWDGALALIAPATAKSGEGDFAAVTLIAEQAGNVNLTLQAQMTDQQGNYLLQNSTDYTFTIAESVTLTGNISSLSTAGDYAFVTLLINGQPVTINPDGSFSVRVGLGDVTMALSAPGYLTAEKQVNLATGQADIDFGQINLVGGDSNGDNQIDIADLTLLLGAYRSVEGEQNGYVMAADFNRDGAINLRDLTLLGANFGKQ
ncbi:dockerin type I domain-containing protein, partial [Pseudoalteromonas sp. R3]